MNLKTTALFCVLGAVACKPVAPLNGSTANEWVSPSGQILTSYISTSNRVYVTCAYEFNPNSTSSTIKPITPRHKIVQMGADAKVLAADIKAMATFPCQPCSAYFSGVAQNAASDLSDSDLNAFLGFHDGKKHAVTGDKYAQMVKMIKNLKDATNATGFQMTGVSNLNMNCPDMDSQTIRHHIGQLK